jgi:hypothetical protein
MPLWLLEKLPLKFEVTFSSETFVPTYRITARWQRRRPLLRNQFPGIQLYPGNVCFLLGRLEARFLSQSVRRNIRHRTDQIRRNTLDTGQIRRNTLDTDQIRRKNTRHWSDQKEEHSTLIRWEGTLNTDENRRKDTLNTDNTDQIRMNTQQRDQTTPGSRPEQTYSKNVRRTRYLNECTKCSQGF